jgi:hypothetical protein
VVPFCHELLRNFRLRQAAREYGTSNPPLDSILIPVPATSLVGGGRQKHSGRRREFSGRSIHRDAQSALTCPFYFAGFHNNKP